MTKADLTPEEGHAMVMATIHSLPAAMPSGQSLFRTIEAQPRDPFALKEESRCRSC